MILNILFIISIVFHCIALVVSLRLLRITKFRAAWILFSIAYTLMLFQLIMELLELSGGFIDIPGSVSASIRVATSLCFVAGLLVVDKLLSYIGFMERKRILNQRRILNTIIVTEEKERRRFSKDLHDNLGPLLSSAKLSISALSSLEATPSQREIVENATFVIEEAIKSLKETSNNLSPHVLDNFGVLRAISTFINKLTLPSEASIKLLSNMKDRRYSEDIEAFIYRVACELINNAIKYSGATEIVVSVQCEGRAVELMVSDNGGGFDYEKISGGDTVGMGLSNIKSRVSSLKGELVVDSAEGKGTTIKISIKTK